jgi:hypothetical protein
MQQQQQHQQQQQQLQQQQQRPTGPPANYPQHYNTQMQLQMQVPVSPLCVYYRAREIREGWPLLTVGTEVHGDSKRTNESGPPLGLFLGLVVPVQEIFVLSRLL